MTSDFPQQPWKQAKKKKKKQWNSIFKVFKEINCQMCYQKTTFQN